MKPLIALAILAAVAGLVRLVRDAREWATWDRETPEVDDYADLTPMTWDAATGNDHTYRVAYDRATGRYRTTEV